MPANATLRRASAVLALEELRHRAMERAALAGQQLGIDRLPCEGVAKRKLIRRLFHHQLRADQLLDCGCDTVLR